MNAADTNASSAIADWTELTVVSRSSTTDEIETFISDVSTTSTNIAIASRIASRELRAPPLAPGASGLSGIATYEVDHGDRLLCSGIDADSRWSRAGIASPEPAESGRDVESCGCVGPGASASSIVGR